jgi:hypothetical protein
MPTIIVGTEKNFSALRPVLFEGRVSAAAVAEAAEAIKEANPHADLDKLEPGTVLTVPANLPGVAADLQPSVRVSAGSADPVRAVPSHGRLELDALAEAAKARDAATRADRKQLAKAFESTALAAAMKRDKRLAADVEAARNALAEEEGRAKERAAELNKAQAEWGAGLDSLAERSRRLPGVSVVEGRAASRRRSAPS